MESNKLSEVFIKRVKTVVEKLGYSYKELVNEPEGKVASIISISEFTNKIKELKFSYPHIVVSFYEDSKLKDWAIVLYDNEQTNNRFIKLIDASNYPLENDKQIPVLQNIIHYNVLPGEDDLKFFIEDDEYRGNLYKNWDDYVQEIHLVNIKKKNYSWFPNTYHNLPDKEGFEKKIILCNSSANLFKPNSTVNKEEAFEGKTIRLGDLKTYKEDYRLKASKIPLRKNDKGLYYKVENKEVVVVSISGELKPTLIDAKEDKIYVPLSSSTFGIFDNDNIDAEYLVRELQKDYIKQQIEYKLRTTEYNMSMILLYVKYYIPLEHDGLSSIEKQRALVREEQRARIKELEVQLKRERIISLNHYQEILDYCDNKNLISLLDKLERDEVFYNNAIWNECRQVLEEVTQKLPEYLDEDTKEELEQYKYSRKITELKLGDFISAITSKDKATDIPKHIKQCFHMCQKAGNIGSHYSMETENVPYLAKAIIYSMLNILYWCKDLKNKNK